jgi:enoyl-CoA hydratase/carnithine racemase
VIRISRAGERVLLAAIDRTERRNALTAEMYGQLHDAMDECSAAADLSVLVVTGSRDMFTSGNDISEFRSATRATGSRGGAPFLRALADFPKILVFAVEGLAVGVGTTMLLHGDAVFAGSSARLRMPFVDLALTPEAGSSLLLPLRAGYLRAVSAVLLADEMGAAEAHEFGLVTEVTADGAALERALDAAARFAAKSLGALVASKALMRAPWRAALSQALDRELEVFAERRDSAEAQERFAAFLSKTRS